MTPIQTADVPLHPSPGSDEDLSVIDEGLEHCRVDHINDEPSAKLVPRTHNAQLECAIDHPRVGHRGIRALRCRRTSACGEKSRRKTIAEADPLLPLGRFLAGQGVAESRGNPSVAALCGSVEVAVRRRQRADTKSESLQFAGFMNVEGLATTYHIRESALRGGDQSEVESLWRGRAPIPCRFGPHRFSFRSSPDESTVTSVTMSSLQD